MTATSVRPRVAFVGVGWIGRNRMEAACRSGLIDVEVVADTSTDIARDAAAAVGCNDTCASLDEVLQRDVDGVVLATPSALHADQTIAALDRGLAVFCQKPLARTAAETRAVVDAAQRADRLLEVDLSYRHVHAVTAVRDLVVSGALGAIYAVDLTFHNSYGPDKPWFMDPRLAGGGCVIDLGTHLVDLALWTLGWPRVEAVRSRLFHRGRGVADPTTVVEDHAFAELELADTSIRLACSWFVDAGADAVIEATFFGRDGATRVENVNGSFYDFRAVSLKGRSREVLVHPPDEWGGRAITRWAERLASGQGFDPEVRNAITVAETLDRIYGRAS